MFRMLINRRLSCFHFFFLRSPRYKVKYTIRNETLYCAKKLTDDQRNLAHWTINRKIMKSKLINKNWYSWEETVRMNNPSIVSPGGGKQSMPTVGRICEKGGSFYFSSIFRLPFTVDYKKALWAVMSNNAFGYRLNVIVEQHKWCLIALPLIVTTRQRNSWQLSETLL